MVGRKRKSRKKKKSHVAAIVLVAFLLLLGVAVTAAWVVLTPFGPSAETFVEVAPGSSTARIGQQLQAAGVVRNRYAFELVRLWKRGTLRAGEYRFDHPAPAAEVYARIVRGDVFTRTVTIPEGSNLFDVAGRLEQAGFGAREDFLAAATKQVSLVADLDPRAKKSGRLSFPRHVSPGAQGNSGTDLRYDGSALSGRCRAAWFEGERARRGDQSFAGGTRIGN
jgi:UPF0755 protein